MLRIALSVSVDNLLFCGVNMLGGMNRRSKVCLSCDSSLEG